MATPKWFQNPESEVSKSRKQEKRISKKVNGRTTVASGAAFKENDVVSKELDIEAKRTEGKQYTLKRETWDKAKRRTKGDKITALVIEFDDAAKPLTLVAIELDELVRLLNK